MNEKRKHWKYAEDEIVQSVPKKKGRPKGALGKKKNAPAPKEMQATTRAKADSNPKPKKRGPPSPHSHHQRSHLQKR